MSKYDVARFFAQVSIPPHSRRDRAGGATARSGRCWVWRGATQKPMGYGLFSFENRPVLAHRFAFAYFNGAATADTTIRHSCDNPPCCNPDHLLRGTNAENVADRVARNRGGSKFRPDDIHAIRRRVAAGESQRSVGADYGVTQGAVSAIIRRKSWSHIP